MNVVADTSPLSYLLLIENVAILPTLFGRIHIPQAVRDELSSPRSPAPLRAWIEEPPTWLQIHRVSAADAPALNQLHAGEREAIILAEALGADLIILDEKAAPSRRPARAARHGIARASGGSRRPRIVRLARGRGTAAANKFSGVAATSQVAVGSTPLELISN